MKSLKLVFLSGVVAAGLLTGSSPAMAGSPTPEKDPSAKAKLDAPITMVSNQSGQDVVITKIDVFPSGWDIFDSAAPSVGQVIPDGATISAWQTMYFFVPSGVYIYVAPVGGGGEVRLVSGNDSAIAGGQWLYECSIVTPGSLGCTDPGTWPSTWDDNVEVS